MKKWVKALLALIIICVVIIIATTVYSSDYYHAVGIESYLESDEKVTAIQIKDGYFFDGPGTEDALIFYPGGKVEETAYAPLLHSLAEQGMDCFLLKMPLRLAVFGGNKADDILDEYNYTHYYLAGHSLGGAMIANYSAKHLGDCSGLFLLAAYPTADLTEAKFPIVFIYGENDTVLNRDKLEESFSLVPPDYSLVEIKGGNHAQFGSYGEQEGDASATVSAEEQWNITSDTILQTVK